MELRPRRSKLWTREFSGAIQIVPAESWRWWGVEKCVTQEERTSHLLCELGLVDRRGKGSSTHGLPS